MYEILTGLLTLFFVNVHIIGYTYIQFTDVEQEQNGIFNYDRTPKFDPERLKAVFGKVPAWTTK